MRRYWLVLVLLALCVPGVSAAQAGHRGVPMMVGDLDRDGSRDIVLTDVYRTPITVSAFSSRSGRLLWDREFDGPMEPGASWLASAQPARLGGAAGVVLVRFKQRDPLGPPIIPGIDVGPELILDALGDDGHTRWTQEFEFGAPPVVRVQPVAVLARHTRDGDDDVLAVIETFTPGPDGSGPTRYTSVLFRGGDGTELKRASLSRSNGRHERARVIATRDLNGDGASDLLLVIGDVGPADRRSMTAISGDDLSVLWSATDPRRDSRNLGEIRPLHDVTGDGHPDLLLLWGEVISDAAAGVTVMSGATGAVVHTRTYQYAAEIQADGKGPWELVAARTREQDADRQAVRVTLFDHTGRVIYSVVHHASVEGSRYPSLRLALGDFDGDGVDDSSFGFWGPGGSGTGGTVSGRTGELLGRRYVHDSAGVSFDGRGDEEIREVCVADCDTNSAPTRIYAVDPVRRATLWRSPILDEGMGYLARLGVTTVRGSRPDLIYVQCNDCGGEWGDGSQRLLAINGENGTIIWSTF
jgi:hypothetical protein